MGKQSAQANAVVLTPNEKEKLDEQGALSAAGHISAANTNHIQGLLAPEQRSPEQRSQEPENTNKPYTRIGGKKKTRKKRKTRRKTRRKTKRKRKRKKRKRKTRKRMCKFRK
jgi:hypothetical protein